MAFFVTNESSEDSFTLTASQPWHLDPSNYILLNQATSVRAFTAAQYNGVNIYALDHTNAQILLNGKGQSFQGYLLNPAGQAGLNNVTLPAGQWWIGVTYNGSPLGSGQTVAGFDEVSTVSLPGSNFIANVPLGVNGNAGAWRSQGFTITGNPSLYIETEGSGGEFMIQTAAQYQAFQSAYANGYNGGSYSYIYALGGQSGGAATEIEGELLLPAGTYYLTWLNDTGSWAGGAADISAFAGQGGGGVTAIAPPPPTVISVTASPNTGNVAAGGVVILTVTMSSPVTVSRGTPFLSLNDGGTASYDAARSNGTSLVFDYKVQANQSAAALGVTGFNANGASITDANGAGANLAGAVATFAGLGINLPPPAVVSVTASPGSGDVATGGLVTLTVTMSRSVTVSGGTPALSLNDGGSALYDAARSNGTALVFDYTVQSGQTTAALAVTGLNANGALIRDASGTGANLAAIPATFIGLGINNALIDKLNLNQQLELTYIGYFNRSADSGGLTFWGGQNAQAQSKGQSAAQALTNIANSFTPQTETVALYPFLGTAHSNLGDPSVQAGLGTLVDTVYGNLLGRAADPGGRSFWLGALSSGVVPIGAAILAIANGATASDAIRLQNKITVALDFTLRTGASGLGTSSLSASFKSAAHNVLNGVDGQSLNDASVTAGISATAAYIRGSASGGTTALAFDGGASSAVPILGDIADPTTVGTTALSSGVAPPSFRFINDRVTALTLNDPGPGSDSATDQASGFNLDVSDGMDPRDLLAAARLNVHDTLVNPAPWQTIPGPALDSMPWFTALGVAAVPELPVATHFDVSQGP